MIMVKPWDGRERRKPTPEGREGRRPGDRHCAQHDILWNQHDKDTEQHRGLVCGKILKVEGNLAREVERLERVDEALRKVDESLDIKIQALKEIIVGKYWFRIIVGFLCGAVVALGLQQNWAFKEILSNQREFSVAVNAIENKQIEGSEQIKLLGKEVETLGKRQDLLRDLNIKHMTEDHKR
jgi:hypothetical protein